jgi:hypothetical protein
MSQCKNGWRTGYATVVRLEKHKGEDGVDLNKIESLIKNKIQNKFLPELWAGPCSSESGSAR